MTLRMRLAALTAIAVALAVAVVSVTAWFLIRATLISGIDDELRSHLPQVSEIAQALPQGDEDSPVVRKLDRDQIGAEVVAPDGSTVTRLLPGEVTFDKHPDLGKPIDLGSGPQLADETIDSARYRMLTVPVGNDAGDAVRLIKPLDALDSTMTTIGCLLALAVVGGMVLAGIAGWTISRAGLRPVRKLAGAAELVATTHDLGHRVDVKPGKGDEVSRVASSINFMLAALDEARGQQRRLVDDVGHELRTPLATLRNDLGVLLRMHEKPHLRMPSEDYEALLRDLDSEAAVLTDLVAEVLDLARGDFEPEPAGQADVTALAERAVERARRVNPDVIVTASGQTAMAMVRVASVERAIANLVRNAVQASDAGQQVEVTTVEQDHHIVVTVLDRGPGLDEADLERVFDRFYRGANARSRPGSGLGLAIVAQVAEQHGGTVTAQNRAGGGARFTLRIPVPPGDEEDRRS